MKRFWLLCSLLLLGIAGCSAKKPAQGKPSALKLPKGYGHDGYCIPEAIDAKGEPSQLVCKREDGTVYIYRRIEGGK